MKHKLLILPLLLLAAGLLKPEQTVAQSTEDTKNIITNIFTIGEAARARQLQRQNAAIKQIKEIFESLQHGGSAQDALDKSLRAIEQYPRFSTPYLLAAFASLQLDNPLNAHRFLALYDRVAREPENTEMNKDVPADFVAQIRSQTSADFAKLSKADIETKSYAEGWIKQAVDVSVDPSLHAFVIQDGPQAPPDGMTLHLSANYHRYIWFDKARTLSTLTGNNRGVDLSGGIDYRQGFGNSEIYPSRQLVTIQPGVFLGRWYIAPFKLQYSMQNKYTQVNDYYPSRAPHSQLFLPFPEFRYYTKFVNGYSHDFARVNKPITQDNEDTYIYFKYGAESADAVSDTYVYNSNQVELTFGYQFNSSRRVSFGMYLSYGTLSADKYDIVGKKTQNELYVNDDYVRLGIILKFRVY